MTAAQKNPKTHNDSEACLQFESGMVSVFAELADLFGNPRSHGQIYGLLFSSPKLKFQRQKGSQPPATQEVSCLFCLPNVAM